MSAVLWKRQGNCRESGPTHPFLFDEFEHEMVLLKPGVRLSIEGPRPIGAQLRRKFVQVRGEKFCRLVTVLQDGDSEVVVGNTVVRGNAPAVAHQHTEQH